MKPSSVRLRVYAVIGFLSLIILVIGSPVGNKSTWFGAMVMIGLGVWIELSDYDNDTDNSDESS